MVYILSKRILESTILQLANGEIHTRKNPIESISFTNFQEPTLSTMQKKKATPYDEWIENA